MSNEDSFVGKPSRKRSRAHQIGDPRFYCTYLDCPKSFTRKEHLRRHERTHENLKTFTCSFCQRAFARSDVLHRHVQQMHIQKQGLYENLLPSTSSSHIFSKDFHGITPNTSRNLPVNPNLVQVSANMMQSSQANPLASGPGQVNPSATSSIVSTQDLPSSPSKVFDKSDLLVNNSDANFFHDHANRSLNVDLASFSSPPPSSFTVKAPTQGPPSMPQQMDPSLISNSRTTFSPYEEFFQLDSTPDGCTRLDLFHDSLCVLKNRSFASSAKTMDDNLRWFFSSGKSKKRQRFESSSPLQSPVDSTFNQDDTFPNPNRTFLNYYFTATGPMYVAQKCPTFVHVNLLGYLKTHHMLSTDYLAMVTPESIGVWVNAYFSYFHIRWPILHRGTFQISQTPLELLLAMITLGMHFTNNPTDRLLAIEIHSKLRFCVYEKEEFVPPIPLWVYQMLLLIQIFEMLTSTIQQHRLSQLFHPVLIEALRQANPEEALTVHSETFSDNDSNSSLQYWHKWITRESVKRLIFGCFSLDAICVLIFGNQPLLCVTDVSLPLFADEHHWEAENFEVWATQKPLDEPPTILHMLKAFIQNERISFTVSPWNMLLILHGLVSVDVSVKQKKFVPGLKLSKREIDNWCNIIYETYKRWYLKFHEEFIQTGTLPAKHPFVKECFALYHLAAFYSKTKLTYIQSYANSISAKYKEFESMKCSVPIKYINLWANTENAKISICHAIDVMEMMLHEDLNANAPFTTLLYYPWSFYIAALILWSFGYSKDKQSTKVDFTKNYRSQSITYITKMRQLLYEDGSNDAGTIYSKTQAILHMTLRLLEAYPWQILETNIETIRSLLSDL
ncbi:zinc finger protein Zas1 [Schizosaccharomyces cryophilus OY26]|uniref:Zinc finger protein Zas1 n=1 Tax=Schizosaccharomyces cryophilus (strain OY26 / ATCC MYA-4695 / CBS 11777 / NBRC 106824 / NRRL Y48691) TaxID=653667 RepID=S9VU09_SCHCR|nr:zinc finger protein Zas1 [Schizosaccharomyces cryophilus OY26]EPY49585.1 zinc finger protein Zas1 [Schizosaccharomyces cryophilus OY26]